MSDLDEKLLQAIYRGVSLRKLDKVPEDSTNWFKATANGDVYEFVIEPEPIKQAFIDAGWLPIEPAVRKYLEAGGDKNYYVISQEYVDKHCMTGQEWHDQFMKHFEAEFEYPANNPVLAGQEIKRAVAEAAKKATGLS